MQASLSMAKQKVTGYTFTMFGLSSAFFGAHEINLLTISSGKGQLNLEPKSTVNFLTLLKATDTLFPEF
jgi:hypothetical protein